MLKKLMVLLTVVALMAASLASVASAASGTSIMYVKTDNGKSVTVRSAPSRSSEAIGYVKYGGEVLTDWSYAGNDGWTRIVWGSRGDGYIMSRFLVSEKPDPSSNPSKEKEKLEKELASERDLTEPFYIAIRTTRSSGWINFRSGPSKTTSRISSFGDGKELIAVGETTNWYRAQDPDTNKVGYIHKTYATKMPKKYVIETESPDGGVQKLGTVNINGEFDLTCKLPEGYDLQVVNIRGDQIIASVLSKDMTRPQLYLSIAYDETYGDVDRMNDLGEEDLAILEKSFTDMNDVEITYRETGYGTKLLVAREIGTDTDFVDILAIYKGYFIEFNMTPNPKAADQTLTNEQIRMCIDFLTDLNFVPVQ